MVLLTPAEELGLSGLSLDSRVRQAFYAMPAATVFELAQRMDAEAYARKLLYSRHGEPEVIRVLLRPIAVMPDQLAYLNFVSLTSLGRDTIDGRVVDAVFAATTTGDSITYYLDVESGLLAAMRARRANGQVVDSGTIMLFTVASATFSASSIIWHKNGRPPG